MRLLASFLAAACLTSSTAVTASAADETASAPTTTPVEDRGLELADGKLWVSAYFNVAFEAPENQSKELNLDDIGFLARWEALERLSLFVAVEIEDFATWTDEDGFSAANETPAVERLYGDLTITPQTTLRIGKTLTNFGIWNPIRRAPLTWTVERPLITEISFPLHSTGLSLNRRSSVGGWSIDGDIYAQPAGELDRVGDEKAAEALAGGRASLGHSIPDGYVVTGLNGVWFEDDDQNDAQHAVGADLDLAFHGHRLTSELIFTDSTIDENDEELEVEWGSYAQLVSPIYGRLFSVVRGEMVGLQHHDDYFNLILGLAYRSQNDRWLLKLNYQLTDNAVDNRTDGPSVALSFVF